MTREGERYCPGCDGAGTWQTACCSGAGGCSCRGELVDMGPCNVCRGRGVVVEGEFDPAANRKAIEGLHFIGTGSAGTFGLWPNRGGYGT